MVAFRATEPGHRYVEMFRLEREGEPVIQAHLDCIECGQSVFCLAPDTEMDQGYALNAGDIAARVLAHLKTSHDDALPRT